MAQKRPKSQVKVGDVFVLSWLLPLGAFGAPSHTIYSIVVFSFFFISSSAYLSRWELEGVAARWSQLKARRTILLLEIYYRT